MEIAIEILNTVYSEIGLPSMGGDNPTWEQIEDAIRVMEKSDGRVELFERNERKVEGSQGLGVTILGSPGSYATWVTYNFRNYYECDTKILTDARIDASNDEIVGVLDEVRKIHIVTEIETLIEVVKAFLCTGEFIDSHPYVWTDLLPGE